MKEFSKYVGLDVHKETIAVSVAEANGGELRYLGEIANTPEALDKQVKQLRKGGADLSFCYEAGPCGYGIHRQLTDLGWDCQVVAPSLIPKKAGDRVKTDRRDSLMLARLHRAGELTAVWVPDGAQEALRDLTRAREDMKHLQRQAKQRLLAFLLRHGKRYGGKSNWTQAHYRWMEEVKFEHPVQQIVFHEYVDTVKAMTKRVAALRQRAATDGLSGRGSQRTLQRRDQIARWHHQNRQRPCAPGTGGGSPDLSPPREESRRLATACRADLGGGTRDCMEGANAPVRALPAIRGQRQIESAGVHGNRTRTGWLYLGDWASAAATGSQCVKEMGWTPPSPRGAGVTVKE